MASGTGGSRRARAVTSGRQGSQVTRYLRLRPPGEEYRDGGFEYHLMTAAGRQPLPTRQVVIANGSHPPVQLVTIGAKPEPLRPRRPCPARARSTGIWRSLTVNSGRSHIGPDLRHRPRI